MIYKCYECGRVFDDCEVATIVEPYGERHSGCPNCGGAYGEAEKCYICQEYSAVEFMKGNICHDCIFESMNETIAEEFFLATKRFADFMLTEFYGIIDPDCEPVQSSHEAERDFEALFKTYKGTNKLSVACRRYLEEVFEDFAKWLNS